MRAVTLHCGSRGAASSARRSPSHYHTLSPFFGTGLCCCVAIQPRRSERSPVCSTVGLKEACQHLRTDAARAKMLSDEQVRRLARNRFWWPLPLNRD